MAPIWPVALYTVATGGTGAGALTEWSLQAIVVANPASPIHIVARMSLSQVTQVASHDGKGMDRRWGGASDRWSGGCGIPGSRDVGRRLTSPHPLSRITR